MQALGCGPVLKFSNLLSTRWLDAGTVPTPTPSQAHMQIFAFSSTVKILKLGQRPGGGFTTLYSRAFPRSTDRAFKVSTRSNCHRSLAPILLLRLQAEGQRGDREKTYPRQGSEQGSRESLHTHPTAKGEVRRSPVSLRLLVPSAPSSTPCAVGSSLA